MSAIDQSTSSKFLTEERQRAEGRRGSPQIRDSESEFVGAPQRAEGAGLKPARTSKFNTFFILCLLPERFEAPKFIRGEDNQIWSEMRSTRYNTSLLETPKFIYGVSFSIAAYLRKPLCVYVLLPFHD
ncbi:hypothetical protein [Fischerella thermalis]|uniref:hypothetical protein n=1 Tax=Fischerella thermalis TaxID=372787 RepID=UPI00307D36E1